MSEMSMIERVEEAIMLAMNADPKGGSFSRAARAAIEAMREPTEVMVKAGASIYCSEYEAPDIWKDMIDAALGQRDTLSSA